MIREHNLYDLSTYKFIKTCLWPRIWFFLINVSSVLKKEFVSCCRWVECSTIVSQIKFVNSVQVFCILADFFVYMVYKLLREGIEISDYNCAFVYFSLKFYQFCFMDFKALLLRSLTFRTVMSSWWINPFIIMKHTSLSQVIFFALKCSTYDINIATPAFFSVSVVHLFLLF